MTEWIKKNKSLLLIVFAGYLLLQFSKTFMGVSPLSLKVPSTTMEYGGSSSVSGLGQADYGVDSASLRSSGKTILPMPPADYAPQATEQNRLVIQESNMSLLVKDVVDTRNKVVEYAKSNGGYMVNSSTSNPQDAPTGNITIRIPSDKLQEALAYFQSLSVKVVSENLVGTDVTDQYVDIDKRIDQIEKTITKLEQILDSATEISDITNLTQQILYHQEQIDSYKGQKESLEKNAQLARLTLYISTDEIALPYTPNETFRPNVIFKLAVRSLVSSLRNVGEMLIWIGVYSVIWVPALLLYVLIKRWYKNRQGGI